MEGVVLRLVLPTGRPRRVYCVVVRFVAGHNANKPNSDIPKSIRLNVYRRIFVFLV